MESREITSSINSIYNKYYTPQNLRRHMKEVAAVAALICDNLSGEIDKESIVCSALIHDLAQFVKMDFSEKYVKLFDKEDYPQIELFKKKKIEFIKKYGANDNIANTKIARELCAPKKVIDILKSKEISPLDEGWGKTIEEKILLYADMRCAPKGVVSLDERLFEGYKRYNMARDEEHKEYSNKFSEKMKEIEEELMNKAGLRQSDINPLSVKKYFLD